MGFQHNEDSQHREPEHLEHEASACLPRSGPQKEHERAQQQLKERRDRQASALVLVSAGENPEIEPNKLVEALVGVGARPQQQYCPRRQADRSQAEDAGHQHALLILHKRQSKRHLARPDKPTAHLCRADQPQRGVCFESIRRFEEGSGTRW